MVANGSSILASVAQTVSPATQTAAKKSGDTMGKDDFMKLLVAQMQKQDPLNPQDPTEFTSQLVQFSNLEQLTNMNDTLAGINTLNGLTAQSLASSIVGKVATVSGNSIGLTNGNASSLHFNLAQNSAATKITIKNSDGGVVTTIDLGKLDAGNHDYTWNGMDKHGDTAANGNYTYTVDATDDAGKAVATQTQFTGAVTGVDFANGATELIINGNGYSMGDVLKIETAA